MNTLDIRSGTSYPSSELSNFAAHPFEINGVKCNSMEGFLQSLKFKDESVQNEICELVGLAAKNKARNVNWQIHQVLWWKGIGYYRHGLEYQNLLNNVYLALFFSK